MAPKTGQRSVNRSVLEPKEVFRLEVAIAVIEAPKVLFNVILKINVAIIHNQKNPATLLKIKKTAARMQK